MPPQEHGPVGHLSNVRSSAKRAALAFSALATVIPAALLAGPGLAPAVASGSGQHLIVAFPTEPAQLAPAIARARADGLLLDHELFRGHADWNVWDVQTVAGLDAATGVARAQQITYVRWAELDQTLTYIDRAAPAAATSSGAALPAVRVGETTSAATVATRSSTAPAPPATPPSSCAPATGLAAGTPNDPLYCDEVGSTSNQPQAFYAEEWNNFCFVPSSQTGVETSAPATPHASGMCTDAAWKLGAQAQGTVIAVLDSGVDYSHPDLVNQMVDETNDPLLTDANFPGTASDGHKHGWNFYDDNAEPMDFYGHGTGRAGIAAAQADNGIGLAGVAPRAKIMAVKVGDTYVVHSENLAEGAVYAADHGADAINTSLGATGNSHLLREAIVYAYTKGVVWAAATANEYSTHHNFPTDVDTVIGAGGLGPDAEPQPVGGQGQTCAISTSGVPSNCVPAPAQTTFLQKVNYANYAGIQTFATPIDTVSTRAAAEAHSCDPLASGCYGTGDYTLHNGGTSTATPHVAGAAAVVRSAGFVAGLCQGHANIGGALTGVSCTAPSLSANEVRQLLAYTALRVHNDDATTGTNDYPPDPSGDPSGAGGAYYPEQAGDAHLGWNIWAGFGRIDLYAAAAYAEASDIPPEAQLFGDTPPPGYPTDGAKLFGVYDPTSQHTLDIVGHVGAPHLPTGDRVDWKVQVAPCMEPAEADFMTITTGTGARDGSLTTWTLPSTLGSCANAGVSHPFSPPGTYTVRVLSQINHSTGAADAVADPVASSDPNYAAPGATAPAPAALIGQDRRVVYLRPHSSHDHLGSPYYIGASGEGSPTLYDIEGKGQLDIIEATANGTVVALRPDGTAVPGWPVAIDDLSHLVPHPEAVEGTVPSGQIVGSVAVGDIDGDGQPEVVAASFKGGLYAWHRDGSRVAGFPVQIPPTPAATNPPEPAPNVPDSTYCTSAHPASYHERYSDYGSISAPVLAPLEGQASGLDIVQAASNQCVYAVKPNGTILWSYFPVDPTMPPGNEPRKIGDTPAVGSLAGNGRLDVVFGTEEVSGGAPNSTGRIYAVDGVTGTLLPGWPVRPASVSASGVPTVATGVISSPALFANPGGGLGLLLADGVFLSGDSAAHPVQTYDATGAAVTTLQTTTTGGGNTSDAFLWGVTQTALGTLGTGTTLDIVTGGLSPELAADQSAAPGKKPTFQHLVGAWDASNGTPVATFPRQTEDWQFLSGPAIADVKGDGSRQVITGNGAGWLHAYDPGGTPAGGGVKLSTALSNYTDFGEPAGFPVFEGGGYITSTPAVAQLTRGGPVSVVNVTRDGYVFVTDTAGLPSANDQWWKFHHDERNSGLYGLDTRPPATVTNLKITVPDSGGQSTVTWTEVGDDWWVGHVASVDLRWSTSPITAANFSSAHQVSVASPVASGATESVSVGGLPTGQTIYVAERGTDDAGNVALLARASALPPLRDDLIGISCPTTSFCMGVGAAVNSSNHPQTLTETWNGSAWSLVSSLDSSATQTNFLRGVSCTSASFCMAVGNYITGGVSQTLIERWNGSTWSIVTSPDTSTTQANTLYGVSCTSGTFCMAVGTDTNSGGHPQTLAERWNGSAWTIVTTFNTSTSKVNQLSSVSCASTSFCMAAGNYVNSSSHLQTLVERWNGTAWSQSGSPNTSTTQNNFLFGVSCVSTAFCAATGNYVNSGGHPQTLTEMWSGTAWSTATSPNTSSTQANVLNDVSCASASFCTAVGYYVNAGGTSQTLIEKWNGTAWSKVTSPNSSSTQANVLNGVSCTSASSCGAVGYYVNNLGLSQTLAERWNGTSWTKVSSPNA